MAVAYLACALIVHGFSYYTYKSGMHIRLGMKNLLLPEIVFGLALQNVFVYLAPSIGFFFLINIFAIFVFGMMSLTIRQFLSVMGLASLMALIVISEVGSKISFPVETRFGLALLTITLIANFSRCAYVNAYIFGLRRNLAKSNKELRASLKRIEELASHDALTQLPNSHYLTALLRKEESRARRMGTTFCVAILDLDHFKSVNDRFGHAIGDKVLKEFSRRMNNTNRATDHFGRYGGQEFLMLLIGTSAADAVTLLERVRSLAADIDWERIQPGLVVTVSIGASEFRNGESIERLLERADTALYAAKTAGRNCVVISHGDNAPDAD
jgi:diguanylate cyclase (GGDEF)-like protein